jgi:hypothetical protein
VTGRLAHRFVGFVKTDGKYYEGGEPMTVAEFRALKLSDVTARAAASTA